jgi:hypothetical protein
MATKNEWLALAERCEKATASDWDIDEAIMRALGLLVFVTREGRLVYDAETDAIEKLPELTKSMDAFDAMMKRDQPTWGWCITSLSAAYVHYSADLPIQAIKEGLPALALCVAFCRAKAARAKE